MVWVQKPWLKNGSQQGQKKQSWQNGGGNRWQDKDGGKASSAAPPPVPPNFQVDSSARYTGVVSGFWKFKGYGFLTLDQKGVVPGDKIFAYWRNIQSDDRFPTLMKGTQVEFGLQKWKGPEGSSLRAKTVTLPGGAAISLQDDLDAQNKSFVGGQHLRYTGMLSFFSPRNGFGYITIDSGYALDAEITKSELRVETAEVNAGGKQPRVMKDLNVEFGIWQTKKGGYKAYNMTLPGGLPLTQEALENRSVLGGRTYRGQVVLWNWRQGWGYVQPDASAVLPPQVAAKIAQQKKFTLERGKELQHDKVFYFRKVDCHAGFKPQKGGNVSFQIYTDDKGAGACEIH